jgi:tetratricopeptide (TPR) repeat protein
MKDLSLLPRLDRLFALGFLGENRAVAYAASGAFVGWVHDRFGSATVRAWYGGTPLPLLARVSWAQLEEDWHRELDRIALPEAARAEARAQFDHPALFGRRCPHVIDGCKAQAARLSAASDYSGAIGAYEKVLELDPHDDGSRLAIARLRLRTGAENDGKAGLERVAGDPGTSRAVRDRAFEDLMDLALATGDVERAEHGYAQLLGRTVDEDARRTLDVKIAAARDERGRRAVVTLLIGGPGRSPDRMLAIELLRLWADTPPVDGLPYYLLGRQYFGAGQLDEARDRLDRALAAPIAVPRVRVEADRLRLLVACSLGERDAAQRAYENYAAHPEVSLARREGAKSLLERCAGSAMATRVPSL